MAREESGTDGTSGTCEQWKSFGQKCSHIVKKQGTKFYILRRCIFMLVCWHDHERGRGRGRDPGRVPGRVNS